jgi:hypothetical protein
MLPLLPLVVVLLLLPECYHMEPDFSGRHRGGSSWGGGAVSFTSCADAIISVSTVAADVNAVGASVVCVCGTSTI